MKTHNFRKAFWGSLSVLAMSLGAANVQAQIPVQTQATDYPNKPITMVMPYAPGGPGDTITRLFAASMQKHLGQQSLVVNTAGASGAIGSTKVARSKPDGYMLLMIHVSHATNLAMF